MGGIRLPDIYFHSKLKHFLGDHTVQKEGLSRGQGGLSHKSCFQEMVEDDSGACRTPGSGPEPGMVLNLGAVQ